jgi:hypothetical protein
MTTHSLCISQASRLTLRSKILLITMSNKELLCSLFLFAFITLISKKEIELAAQGLKILSSLYYSRTNRPDCQTETFHPSHSGTYPSSFALVFNLTVDFTTFLSDRI